MLQYTGSKFRQILTWIIIVILALIFLLLGLNDFFHENVNYIIASINGNKITINQFQAAYDNAREIAIMKEGTNFIFDKKKQDQMKQQVFNKLINDEVILQSQINMGLVLDHKYEKFKKIIFNSQLKYGIVNSEFLLADEKNIIQDTLSQRRDFMYLTISPRTLFNKVHVTKEEIINFYNKNHEEFNIPEKINIQYIKLSKKNLKNNIEYTELQLKQFYYDYIEYFSTPQKWCIAEITAPVITKHIIESIKNTKYALDNKKINLKSDNKVNIFWISSNDVSPDLKYKLNNLITGQVYGPLHQPNGYYSLIKIIVQDSPKPLPYEQIHNNLEKLYIKHRISQELANQSTKLSNIVYTHPNDLTYAAQIFGVKLKETGFLSKKEILDTKILSNHKILDTIFNSSLLKQHYNSDVIYIGGGEVIVLRIKNILPKKIKPIEQVYPIIIEKLKKQKADIIIQYYYDNLKNSMNDASDFLNLAKKYKLSVQYVNKVKYNYYGNNNPYIEKAFSLKTAKNQNIGIINIGNDIIIIYLKKIYKDTYKINHNANLYNVITSIGINKYNKLINYFFSEAKIIKFNKSL